MFYVRKIDFFFIFLSNKGMDCMTYKLGKYTLKTCFENEKDDLLKYLV